MNIYLAAMLNARGTARPGDTSHPEAQVSADVRHAYPWTLESYHYLPKVQGVEAYLRDHNKTIFLDSGAFTVFTKGGSIDVEEYARYCRERMDLFCLISNVDVIGRGQEQATYDNQKHLEDLGVPVCPVHHARDHDRWLERYLAEGYPYIFLGGMVAEDKRYLRHWLDHVWERYLTNPDGSARVKVHGFGLTTPSLMWRYPWESVDSTSWVMMSSYGSVMVDLPHQDVQVCVSSESPAKHQLDRHYTTLPPSEHRAVTARIAELGYRVEDLAKSYGWRDRFNIEYYRRASARPTKAFIRREQTLF